MTSVCIVTFKHYKLYLCLNFMTKDIKIKELTNCMRNCQRNITITDKNVTDYHV